MDRLRRTRHRLEKRILSVRLLEYISGIGISSGGVDSGFSVWSRDAYTLVFQHTPEATHRMTLEVSQIDKKVIICEMASYNVFREPFLSCMEAERLLVLNTSACVGCGICSTVCPHGNFTITDKASFSGSCEYCLACVHSCPQKALTLARGERNPQSRFCNENVSLADLRRANCQI